MPSNMYPNVMVDGLQKLLQLFLFLISSPLCSVPVQVLPSRSGVYFLLLESGLVLGLALAHSKGIDGVPAQSPML